jgi:hypothetical protein
MCVSWHSGNQIVLTGIGLYCVNSNSGGDVAVSFDDVLLTTP